MQSLLQLFPLELAVERNSSIADWFRFVEVPFQSVKRRKRAESLTKKATRDFSLCDLEQRAPRLCRHSCARRVDWKNIFHHQHHAALKRLVHATDATRPLSCNFFRPDPREKQDDGRLLASAAPNPPKLIVSNTVRRSRENGARSPASSTAVATTSASTPHKQASVNELPTPNRQANHSNQKKGTHL